jgi:hypothetical protein
METKVRLTKTLYLVAAGRTYHVPTGILGGASVTMSSSSQGIIIGPGPLLDLGPGSLEAGNSHVPMSQQLLRFVQIHADELLAGLHQLQRAH